MSDFECLAKAKNLGICTIPLNLFSTFVAYDCLRNGYFSLKEFNFDEDFSLNNEVQQKAILPFAKKIQNCLVDAVEKEKIQATVLVRDIQTGKINLNKSLIEMDEIWKFIEIYDLADYVGNESLISDYLDKEMDLFSNVVDYIEGFKKLKLSDGSPNFEEKSHLLKGDEKAIETMLMNNFLINNENIKLRELQKISPENQLKQRERSSLYRIIAALFETCLDKKPSEKLHLKNQSSLIAYLDHHYDGYEGLTKAKLEEILPIAKGLLNPS